MNFFDFTFWQNFASNALATIIGAMIGIPIALGLNKYQERSSETERKKKILRLLQEELLINYGQLTGWKTTQNKILEVSVIGPFLRDESWRAFSDGGELQWIKNPKLLSELANAYKYIGIMQQLSGRYLNLKYLTPMEKTNLQIINYFETMIDKGIDESIDMVNKALKAITDEK